MGSFPSTLTSVSTILLLGSAAVLGPARAEEPGPELAALAPAEAPGLMVPAPAPAQWLGRWDASCEQDGVNRCREDWYLTPEGSHLVTWDVFVALEDAESSQRFASPEVLGRYGMLHAPAGGGVLGQRLPAVGEFPESVLPLGLLRDDRERPSRTDPYNEFVGVSCAACHTGEVTYAGHRYLVEGGQSMVDFHAFMNGLRAALEASRSGPRHERLAARFQGDPAELDRMLARDLEQVEGFLARNAPLHPNGPARLDAIGSILNEVLVHQAGQEEGHTYAPLEAPVSLPYVWGVNELSCVQTNCLSQNPVSRNIGQAVGVFGTVDFEPRGLGETANLIQLSSSGLGGVARAVLGDSPLFDTTAKIPNLVKLEDALGQLESPSWTDTALPVLDAERVAQGRTVYTAHCAGCHVDVSDGVGSDELTEPNANGARFVKVGRVPYDEVGTDPTFIEEYGSATRKTGVLGRILKAKVPDREYTYVDPETGATAKATFGERIPTDFNALKLLGLTTAVVLGRHQNTAGFTEKAREAYPDLSTREAREALMRDLTYGQVQSTRLSAAVYRAKPLYGIAFTSPYLHNGSVPTLHDLLLPPEQRPQTFLVGSRELDPEKVGYRTDPRPGVEYFVFDTRLRGNSNAGHVYGTELDAADRLALLEYLKSI